MIHDRTAAGEEYWWDAWVDDKGVYHYRETYDFAPVINSNMVEQQSGKNGWTPDRTMRLIARIPAVLYNSPDFRALEPEERQLFLRWFLEQHPEYRTVDKLLHVGANDGHVIIR